MPAKGHALLGASSASRWINCSPSARLCDEVEDKTSSFALEGTDAHALCEYKLQKALGKKVKKPNLEWYTAEMENCANEYVSFVIESVEELKKTCSDTILLVEQEVSFTKWVPDGFGTADALIIADSTLHVIDFKYGQGVPVSAENNPQMFLYALGALSIYDGIYSIDNVVMTIFQPRLSNVSTFSISKDELYKWADEILKPKAELAYKGEGEFNCGAWCRFCKVKAVCKKRADENMKLAEMEFKDAPLLTDDEIEEVLIKVDDLVSWANEVKEFATTEAIKGKKWKHFKIVEGRSNRKYSDEDKVIEVLTTNGIDPFEKKLLSITELTKQLGKPKFSELLDKFIVKPQGKPTLVSRDDKRPEFNLAVNDFKDIQEEN